MNTNYRKYPPKEIFVSFVGREATEEERWQGVEGGIIHNKKTGIEVLDCLATLVRRHMHHYAGFYADQLGVTVIDLSGFMKVLTGMTTEEWIDSYIWLCVGDLLSHTKYSVSEIARLTGYTSVKTFSHAFTDRYGMSPSRWRRR